MNTNRRRNSDEGRANSNARRVCMNKNRKRSRGMRAVRVAIGQVAACTSTTPWLRALTVGLWIHIMDLSSGNSRPCWLLNVHRTARCSLKHDSQTRVIHWGTGEHRWRAISAGPSRVQGTARIAFVTQPPHTCLPADSNDSGLNTGLPAIFLSSEPTTLGRGPRTCKRQRRTYNNMPTRNDKSGYGMPTRCHTTKLQRRIALPARRPPTAMPLHLYYY